MKTLNVILNQSGQTDAETLKEVYALILPTFRTAKHVRMLFNNAVKTMRTWKSHVYECEFCGSLFIFSHSADVLRNYKPDANERRADVTPIYENTNL